MIRFLKPALFLACLGPAAWLVYGAFLGGDLGVNPVETITNYTGIWTLRLIAISLAVSPLRWLTGWNRIIQYRRMLGLFAFFYGTLHFMTYFVLDHSLVFAGLWDDVVKRPYITAGFTAFMLMVPLAITSTQGLDPAPRRPQLEPAAPAGLRHGAAGGAALLVEGEARHLEPGALRGDHGHAARRPGLEGAGEASCRAAGVASGPRGAAGLMARLSIAALATVAMLAGCAPAGDGAEAEAAAGGADAGRQALLTINHLEPRPDFVGPQPARFTWTPIAGADSYAIGLVSEIDTVVWQRADIPAAEVAWPAGLDLPAGTYFWMIEGFTEGRRIAESGRAAFVLER